VSSIRLRNRPEGSPIDGIVGDLFAGSGAAGEAAMRAGRRYAGCEIDPEMAAKANDRLSALLPMTLR
jgi:site-specific DNA-methyltransferase (adenine-specific)